MCPYSRDEPWDFYWEIFFFFYRDLWTKTFMKLTCLVWYDQESPASKGSSQCMWEAAAHCLFRQRCVSFSLTHSWWEILRFLCGCVCVCQIADMVVCECVKLRREFTRWHLVSCLTFPVSQGSSFKNNAEEKPPTSDNWNATKGEKKKPGPVCWWLNYCRCLRSETGRGKRVSDCTVRVADTYHLPDSSTHPSRSTPHNSRNT